MAKNILKEAIADAKAVREVALANAKAALEEAFTPRLQSMLSAKLSEELEEDTLEETEGMEPKEDMDEIMEPMREEEEEVTENYMEEMDDEELDEEVNLEEILAELELEESEIAEGKKDDDLDEAKDDDLDEAKDEDLDEAKDDDLDEAKDDDLEEVAGITKAQPKHTDVLKVNPDYNMMNENENFDLDALLEEINNLDETEEDLNEFDRYGSRGTTPDKTFSTGLRDLAKDASSYEDWQAKVKEYWINYDGPKKPAASAAAAMIKSPEWKSYVDKIVNETGMYEALETELDEVKAALKVKTTELNEVNLLNSKLLYVNRIFKANTLNEGQKLRVVESLDNAGTIKEAKLIYETIKDSFNIVGKTKKKSIKEGFGMASKATGNSLAKKEVITESNNMVARFQKLANIKIND